MLQIFQRCLGLFRPAGGSEVQSPTTVLLVRVPFRSEQPPLEASPRALPPDRAPLAAAPLRYARQTPGDRQQTHGSSTGATLRQLGIFPQPVASRLARLGVRTAADLLAADPRGLADRLGGRGPNAAKIRRRQRAIRFSRRFSEMTPLEALLLFATHRRSGAALAADSPGMLRRDLQRLLLSSAGQRLSGGLAAPDVPRVRLWISEARLAVPAAPRL